MKKFAIIGANSSIARNFTYFLKDKDVEVVLYDIQNESADGLPNYNKIDLLDKKQVENIDFDSDAIFVFSGLTGGEKSFEMYSEFVDINEKTILNLLDVLRRKNSKARIVYPSSRLVYKNSDCPHKEDSEKEGLSVYAINKIAVENYIQTYNKLFGVEFIVFRIAIPFGKLNPQSTDYGIVAKFRRQAEENGVITLFGEGGGKRTFTHIEDLCNVLYQGAIKKEMANEVYNVGGCTYSLSELAEIHAKKTGAKIVKCEWPEVSMLIDVPNGQLDYSKLNAVCPIEYKDIKHF